MDLKKQNFFSNFFSSSHGISLCLYIMFDMGQYLLLKHLGYVMIWRGGIAGLGGESQEGEDKCVLMADSHCC